jgi:hypothetical protein
MESLKELGKQIRDITSKFEILERERLEAEEKMKEIVRGVMDDIVSKHQPTEKNKNGLRTRIVKFSDFIADNNRDWSVEYNDWRNQVDILMQYLSQINPTLWEPTIRSLLYKEDGKKIQNPKIILKSKTYNINKPFIEKVFETIWGK